jgi:glycosyltransferase involved in cell wall biosynthesis
MEWAVHHLSNHLVRQGHRVRVLTAVPPGNSKSAADLAPFAPEYELASYEFGFRGGEWLGRNLHSVLHAIGAQRREFGFDVLHAHGVYLPGYAALRGQRRWHYPLVITDHGHFFYMQLGTEQPSSNAMRRRMFQTVRHAPCQTAPGLESFEMLMRERKTRDLSRPLPNGIGLPDAEYIEHLLHDQRCHKPADEPLRILMVGRNVPTKGFPLGLRALAHLQSLGHSVRLRVVGRDTELLTDLAHELKIEANLELLDALPAEALWREYAAADIYWMPSLSETQGLTKFEAMGFALPVICHNTPGTREYIQPGNNGLLFAANDPGDLAAQTISLLSDSALRLRIGRTGQTLANSMRWEQLVKQYENLYKELAQSEP